MPSQMSGLTILRMLARVAMLQGRSLVQASLVLLTACQMLSALYLLMCDTGMVCWCRMTSFDKDNLNIIFTNLVTWWLHKFNYSQNISKLSKSLVAATLD